MGLIRLVKTVPSFRPSPQDPDRVLRRDRRELMHGPRAFSTLRVPAGPGRILLSGSRPSVAPRIEDIRDPDDRNLRLSLVTRARIWQGGGPQ